ncbi:MAG: CoA pyrophosphatase [Alphaproteobacteria bacterium]|nr:CoA pyrophosphatase [Alphaproteobacteria bacterium]
MTEAELRARLAIPVAPRPPQRGTIVVDNPPALAAPFGSDEGWTLADQPLVPAAVLVSFLQGREPGVLLTRRTAHLNKHAGQVSFPGGRIDPGDGSPEAAALREAQEEVGLDPALVEITGRLGDYVTGTGYRITPIVGLLPRGRGLEDLELSPSPDEVASVFALPMSVLLDPAAPQRRRAHYRGRWREFWVWPHPDHYVWGATAAILVHLADRLRGA